ncbi:cyclic lactone autoinducer peptide [Clostridium sp. CX1]|nr:cyclic lactone autoinducer peptide [Clostridium sp. CX1]MCT8978566.1 cyclic lactone autoinducer peptide [Clostridium sp. CX1]
MKNFKVKALKCMMMLAASAFTFFALSTSASACTWGFYQPEEPKCLREE